MSAKFPRGGGAGPFLARSLLGSSLCFSEVILISFLCRTILVNVIRNKEMHAIYEGGRLQTP